MKKAIFATLMILLCGMSTQSAARSSAVALSHDPKPQGAPRPKKLHPPCAVLPLLTILVP